jgi:hypothetical protein
MKVKHMNKPIMTKEEYLSNVRAWKSEYRDLSLSQRKLKLDIREAQREGGGKPVGILFFALLRGREKARLLLEQRASMKLVAQQAYLLAHPAPSA